MSINQKFKFYAKPTHFGLFRLDSVCEPDSQAKLFLERECDKQTAYVMQRHTIVQRKWGTVREESVRNQFVTTFDGKSSALATIFHSTLFKRPFISFQQRTHKATGPERKIASQKLVSFQIACHTFRLHLKDVFEPSTFLCLCANAQQNCWWQEWRLKREQKTLFRRSRFSHPSHTVFVYGSKPNQKLHSPRFDSHFTLKSFSFSRVWRCSHPNSLRAPPHTGQTPRSLPPPFPFRD